ncbi:MAG TPA: dehydrogenase, partial [Anseongella sp.]|nr:dehydrogenase [Anseongella sp.]
SYMPDTNGTGENRPSGVIAILEDSNGDGRADKRTVFLDSLVLPRAICLVEGGLLVAEPPRLWFVENKGGRAGKKTLVDPAYAVGGNVEHQPNGLYRALDNWIYNAKSSKRYRKKGNKWLIETTIFRGQWGLSQDDQGRLFYNHNSANVLGDYFPPRFGAGNPSQEDVAGYNENIVPDNRVYPLRPTPGINRGYLEGMLDDSLRLVNFTAAGGPLIYRGGLFGREYSGNAFVPEPSANLIKRNILSYQLNYVEGKQAYQNREFLASTDERFRPVSLYDGPDGALYVVDMYRGIIQHVTYLTDYLKNEIESRDLSSPLNRGRIYKILPEGAAPGPVRFPSGAGELADLLDHENGWVRDKAQQLIVDRHLEESIPYLKEKLNSGKGPGRIHALWTLEGLYALRWADV